MCKPDKFRLGKIQYGIVKAPQTERSKNYSDIIEGFSGNSPFTQINTDERVLANYMPINSNQYALANEQNKPIVSDSPDPRNRNAKPLINPEKSCGSGQCDDCWSCKINNALKIIPFINIENKESKPMDIVVQTATYAATDKFVQGHETNWKDYGVYAGSTVVYDYMLEDRLKEWLVAFYADKSDTNKKIMDLILKGGSVYLIHMLVGKLVKDNISGMREAKNIGAALIVDQLYNMIQSGKAMK
jgi:hypothetical protein